MKYFEEKKKVAIRRRLHKLVRFRRNDTILELDFFY